MIILRQREFTSRATKVLRKDLLFKSGAVKKYKSEGFRTVERKGEEVEEELAKAAKEKFGRGWGRERQEVYRRITRTDIPSVATNFGTDLHGKISTKGAWVNNTNTKNTIKAFPNHRIEANHGKQDLFNLNEMRRLAKRPSSPAPKSKVKGIELKTLEDGTITFAD